MVDPLYYSKHCSVGHICIYDYMNCTTNTVKAGNFDLHFHIMCTWMFHIAKV